MKKVSEHLKSKNKSVIADITMRGLKSLYHTAFGGIENFFSPKSLFDLILKSTGIPYIDNIFNGMVSFTKKFFGKKEKSSKSKSENLKQTLKSTSSQNSSTSKNETKSDTPVINDENWKNEQIQEEELKKQNEEIEILRDIKEILSKMINAGNTLVGENSLVSKIKDGMTGGMGAGVAGAIAGTVAGTITSFFTGLKDKILRFIPKLPILTGLTGIVWAIIDGIRGTIEFGGLEGFLGGLFGGLGKGASGAFKNFGKWALLGAAAGMAFPPFGPIIGGAIGAIFGGILGYFGGQKITDFITDISDFIADAFYSIGENIKLQFDLFSNTASIVLESLQDEIIDPISDFANRIGSTFKTIWKLAKISLKEMKEEALFWVNPKNWGSSWIESEDYKNIQKEKEQIKQEIQNEKTSLNTPKPKKDLKAKLADLNKKTYEEFEENKKIHERAIDERNVNKQKERAFRSVNIDNNELGQLSAKFESGSKGSEAIGWDTRGGTSYGKYQIASKTGTMDEFLNYAKKENPEVYERLIAAGPSDGGKNGNFANEWKKLASEGKIQDLEHGFIKKTHFDASLKKLTPDLQEKISKNKSLQDVLWSTSVQHGAGGAASIFNKSYNEGLSDEDLISNIYSKRSDKLSKLAPNERASVINRYREEKELALMMNSEIPSVVNQKPVTSEQKVQTLLAKANTSKPETTQTINNNTINNKTNVQQNEKLNVSNDDYSLYMHMRPI